METEVIKSQTQRSPENRPQDAKSDLSKLGNNIVTKLHVLMRISQIYDSKNAALLQFIQESLQTINALIQKDGTLSLRIVKDDLFLNDQRLHYSVEGFTSFKYLLTHWKKRLIGQVTFKGALDEKNLKEFVYALMSMEEGRQENATALADLLVNRGIESIEVDPLEVTEEEDETVLKKKEEHVEVAKKVFFETVGTVKETITHIKEKQHANVRKLKRLAQKTVHLVMEDETILLGMTTIKNYDEYTFNHSVNVSIYSLAMGRRLGFSKKTLTDLGITALLHDVGKSKIPKEVINKRDSFAEGDWDLMKKHPLMSVETLLNLKQLGEINPRIVVGIFEHHLTAKLSGYPRLFRKKKVSLFGRIIQIADAYDAMTTPRPHRKYTYTPAEALAIMMRERDTHYDAILLKVFIGIISIFPIGSLVLLDTGEIGIVCKTNPDPKWLDRPQVIIVRRDGKDVQKELADLAETEAGGDHFKRSIVKTLDPNKYHIDILKYFLGKAA
ncbi:MAG: HD-GYP domain-containing protein [Thermodesulfobacteriota bacterium]